MEQIIFILDNKFNELNNRLDEINNEINNRLDKIDNKIDELNEINNRLDKIEIQLNIINEKQYDIDKSTKNMDNHIQFIENVYDKIKKPLAFATNKINNLISLNNPITLT